MRRRTVVERPQEEAELARRFLGSDTERVEDALLEFGLVDSNRSRPEFPAVEHEVIGDRPHCERVALDQIDIIGVRTGEGMVPGPRSTRNRVDADEERELDHPDVPVWALVNGRTTQIVSEGAEHLAGD